MGIMHFVDFAAYPASGPGSRDVGELPQEAGLPPLQAAEERGRGEEEEEEETGLDEEDVSMRRNKLFL